MAGLSRAYTHYYHRKYHTAGFLWQGRFKLQPIQKEQYLITCGRYIERNPVKAGMVEFAESYPYSSAQFYCLGKADGITQESPLFVSFGKEILPRQSNYKEFLRNFNAEEDESFERIEEPKGDKEFLRRLIKENGRYLPRRKGKAGKY
jgi:putative transposase